SGHQNLLPDAGTHQDPFAPARSTADAIPVVFNGIRMTIAVPGVTPGTATSATRLRVWGGFPECAEPAGCRQCRWRSGPPAGGLPARSSANHPARSAPV